MLKTYKSCQLQLQTQFHRSQCNPTLNHSNSPHGGQKENPYHPNNSVPTYLQYLHDKF